MKKTQFAAICRAQAIRSYSRFVSTLLVPVLCRTRRIRHSHSCVTDSFIFLFEMDTDCWIWIAECLRKWIGKEETDWWVWSMHWMMRRKTIHGNADVSIWLKLAPQATIKIDKNLPKEQIFNSKRNFEINCKQNRELLLGYISVPTSSKWLPNDFKTLYIRLFFPQAPKQWSKKNI